MDPKRKNIFVILGIVLLAVLIYVLFFRGAPEEAPLTSLGTSTGAPGGENTEIAGDFLALLLSVKNIALDTSVFASPAFRTLVDSSIDLVPEGNEGRANPFAPLGSEF